MSRSYTMSYYVEDNGCCKVIEDLCLEELINAIRGIMDQYSTFTGAALRAGRDLSASQMTDDHLQIYQNVIK